MKSGDILHVVSRAPALVVRSGSPSGIGASLMCTGIPGVLTVAGPTATVVTRTSLLCRSQHSNRSQPCQWVAPGTSAFLAPVPTGTFSERPDIGVAPPSIATNIARATKVERIELAIDFYPRVRSHQADTRADRIVGRQGVCRRSARLESFNYRKQRRRRIPYVERTDHHDV